MIFRNNEPYDLNTDPDNIWNAIGSYMDDDIREAVHAELAPCTAQEFLERYVELDPDFAGLLKIEFSIEF